MTPDESPALLLDASTPWIHAGVLSGGKWLSLERAEGDALTLLPALAKSALEKSGLTITDIRAYLHCEGPGALLGLRLASMMIEAWRAAIPGTNLYAYRSLEAASAILALKTPPPYCVATPFRKGSYTVFTPGKKENELLDEGAFRLISTPKHLIPQRHIKNAPTGETPLSYDLTDFPAALAAAPELLRQAERAVAYAPQYAEYKLWDGQRHKAPPSGYDAAARI